MYCGKCGKQVEDGTKFCPQCGSALPVAGQEPAQTEVVEAVEPAEIEGESIEAASSPVLTVDEAREAEEDGKDVDHEDVQTGKPTENPYARKCPSCGRTIGYMNTCPACGYSLGENNQNPSNNAHGVGREDEGNVLVELIKEWFGKRSPKGKKIVISCLLVVSFVLGALFHMAITKKSLSSSESNLSAQQANTQENVFVKDAVKGVSFESPKNWTRKVLENGNVSFYAENKEDFIVINCCDLDGLITDEAWKDYLAEEKEYSVLDKNTGNAQSGKKYYAVTYLKNDKNGVQKKEKDTFFQDGKLTCIIQLYANPDRFDGYLNVYNHVVSSVDYTNILATRKPKTTITPTNAPTNSPTSTVDPTFNPPTISLVEFDKITTGMSYSEVVEIIGGEGELLSESSVAGYTSKMYSWKGDGDIGANASMLFQNDEVQSKSQYGLK